VTKEESCTNKRTNKQANVGCCSSFCVLFFFLFSLKFLTKTFSSGTILLPFFLCFSSGILTMRLRESQ
jgi:purine-cytosine permease-like protein